MRRFFMLFMAFLLMLVSVCPFFSLGEEEAVLTLPEDVTVIGERAFYGSSSIDKVILPEGISEIHSQALPKAR